MCKNIVTNKKLPADVITKVFKMLKMLLKIRECFVRLNIGISSKPLSNLKETKDLILIGILSAFSSGIKHIGCRRRPRSRPRPHHRQVEEHRN